MGVLGNSGTKTMSVLKTVNSCDILCIDQAKFVENPVFGRFNHDMEGRLLRETVQRGGMAG